MSKLIHQINKGLAHEIIRKIDNFLFDCDGMFNDRKGAKFINKARHKLSIKPFKVIN